MINLQEEHLQIIYTQAEKTYPEECCGILLGYFSSGKKTVVEIIPTENAWKSDIAADFSHDNLEYSKRKRYAIAPQILLQVQKDAREKNLDIIGFFHSHPDYLAIPSEFDSLCAWQEYSYIIVAVQNGKYNNINSWCLDETHQFQPEIIKNLT